MVLVAALGIAINGGTALLFMRGRHGDLNIRGAYLHMAADAGVSLGVVVAALVIMATGWLWVDPAISLGIAAVVLASGWGLARTASTSRSTACRAGIELAEGAGLSARLDGVTELHDLHIWAMSTNETALTAHLVRPAASTTLSCTASARNCRTASTSITPRLQIEASGDVCRLAPAEVV